MYQKYSNLQVYSEGHAFVTLCKRHVKERRQDEECYLIWLGGVQAGDEIECHDCRLEIRHDVLAEAEQAAGV